MEQINFNNFYARFIPRNKSWDNWQSLRDELQYQWELLTGEDLEKIKDDHGQIADVLQRRYGFSDKQAKKAAINFFRYQRCNVQLE